MATLIDILPLWLIAVPATALCGLVFKWGILAVYLAMNLENIFKAIVGLLRFRSGVWINDVTKTANE